MIRKMATIRKIDELRLIPDADSIETAVIGGWTVVVKRGEFVAGDLAVYCEIDSWIPTHLAPFLSKGREPLEFNGIKGERLRSVRLRKQLSQGLLLPMSCLTDFGADLWEGADVSETLGVIKYDAPVSAQLAGDAVGLFPGWIPKTDQERIQNLTNELAEWRTQDLTWEVTEKLDGSSMTVFVRDEEEGVCSRNLQLRKNVTNTLWQVALREQIIEKIRASGRNLAMQGEIIGEAIQGNRYKVLGQQFLVFDIYDIDEGRYLTPVERTMFVTERNIKHVPVLRAAFSIDAQKVNDLLFTAEGKTVMLENGPEREGVVFKCNSSQVSFKVISNSFLLREK
jgi:RNA ligase (TIGR02306 family)